MWKYLRNRIFRRGKSQLPFGRVTSRRNLAQPRRAQQGVCLHLHSSRSTTSGYYESFKLSCICTSIPTASYWTNTTAPMQSKAMPQFSYVLYHNSTFFPYKFILANMYSCHSESQLRLYPWLRMHILHCCHLRASNSVDLHGGAKWMNFVALWCGFVAGWRNSCLSLLFLLWVLQCACSPDLEARYKDCTMPKREDEYVWYPQASTSPGHLQAHCTLFYSGWRFGSNIPVIS